MRLHIFVFAPLRRNAGVTLEASSSAAGAGACRLLAPGLACLSALAISVPCKGYKENFHTSASQRHTGAGSTIRSDQLIHYYKVLPYTQCLPEDPARTCVRAHCSTCFTSQSRRAGDTAFMFLLPVWYFLHDTHDTTTMHEQRLTHSTQDPTVEQYGTQVLAWQ